MAAHGNDHLVIYGYSQGAAVASLEMRKLAEQYPAGTTAPDIDFVLGGDGNLPNGGFLARFPGLYIPILDISFNGPEPTDTQFDTAVIIRQYDFFGDFPLYPINLVADVNALLGFLYVHLYAFDVSLAPDPSTSTPFQGTHGRTSYYFFETQDLPLFGPLRTLGVPESLIDVVEPFFRVLVDLGYDRSIPPWEPTPARLIPTLDPVTVAGDLVNAIGEGINNAAGPDRLATAAEHSRGAGRNHNSGRLRPDDNKAAGHQHRRDDNEAAGHRHRRDDNEAADHRHRRDDNEAAGHRNRRDDNEAAGHPNRRDDNEAAGHQIDETTTRQQATDTDETTTRQQATDTDETTTPTVSTSKPWKRAGRHETPRPVVRGPLGVYGQQIRGLQHSGDADAPTTQTAAADDVATTAGTSSPESPSVGGSPGARSPDGDTDGS